MIIDDEKEHPYGHIQVYYNGRWYSDFKQKTANPWAGCTVKAVYRYSEWLCSQFIEIFSYK